MTNYNERLDEVLFYLTDQSAWDLIGITQEQANELSSQLDYDRAEAKQLITSLIKELVDEQIVQALKELKEEVIGEVPSKMNTDNWKYDRRVAELKIWQHQVIDTKIKQLEEV